VETSHRAGAGDAIQNLLKFGITFFGSSAET
jgi:hypothetical protein